MDEKTEETPVPQTQDGINDNTLPPTLAPQEGEMAEVVEVGLAPLTEADAASLAGAAPVDQRQPPKQDLMAEDSAEVR